MSNIESFLRYEIFNNSIFKKYVDTGSVRVDADVKQKYRKIYTNVRPPARKFFS